MAGVAGAYPFSCSFSRSSLLRASPANVNSRRPFISISAQLEETSSISTEDGPAEGPMATPVLSPPEGFKPPEPRRFYVRGDQWLTILTSSLALPLRLGSGALVQGYKASWVPESHIPPNQYTFLQIAGRKLVETSNLGPRPEKPIEIYEFESCPFCRKVRELVSILDLDVLYYPCPTNGSNFRPKVVQMGGKKQFPYMVDPNTGVSMYESDDIIKYLVEKYGDGMVPMMLSLGIFTTLTAGLAMIGRLGKGSVYTPARIPENPLELWAYEEARIWPFPTTFHHIKASPFCKIVRETLVELELPHIYHSTARGSPRRQSLFKRMGHFQTFVFSITISKMIVNQNLLKDTGAILGRSKYWSKNV